MKILAVDKYYLYSEYALKIILSGIVTVLFLSIFVSTDVFADHIIASVSIPQGTSVPGCEKFNECFIPHEATIDVGGEVTWSNDDSAAHTVTSGSAADGVSGVFDSGLFMAGTTFSHKFEASGEFPYHCVVHPWMNGIVIVTGQPQQSGVSLEAFTSKKSFNSGDVVFVTGQIKDYDPKIHSNIPVTYRVSDPKGESVTLGQVMPNSYGNFKFDFRVGGALFTQSGNYPIQLTFGLITKEIPLYYSVENPNSKLDTIPPKILQPKDIIVNAKNSDGERVNFDVLVIDNTDRIIQPICSPPSGSVFSIGKNIVTCSARDSSGNHASLVSFTITVYPPKTSIPNWIKNVAQFWCADKIDDAGFVEGIQYLIDNKIIIVPSISPSSGSQEVPKWIKNNACWWSKGVITDEDFASGIEYLVKHGIIRV